MEILVYSTVVLSLRERLVHSTVILSLKDRLVHFTVFPSPRGKLLWSFYYCATYLFCYSVTVELVCSVIVSLHDLSVLLS